VKLTCPAENKGILEIIAKKSDGAAARYQIPYPPSSRKTVALAVAEGGSPFKTTVEADPNEESNQEVKAAALKIKAQGDFILKNVCEGSKESKERYQNMLAENASMLPSRASVNEPVTDKKSTIGL
jgi:hypothetical protein